MICCYGGIDFICHNELRDLAASWLREVCHDVAIQPPLQALNGETVVPASANCKDDAQAIFMLEVFGVDDRVHFLILACFIPTDLATASSDLLFN